LLTSIACGFAYKGVTIPVVDQAAVKQLLATKNSTYKEPVSELTPATLEAWMSLNNGQGYDSARSISLDAGKLTRITSRADMAFWGRHAGSRSDYLKLPSAEQLRRWLDAEHILVGRPTANEHHWLWLVGHDGGDNFKVWDVGYPAGNAYHTESVQPSEIDLLNHWGPTGSLS